MKESTKIEEVTPAAQVVTPKPSVSKALQRAALRELKNRKREQYAQEDAADAQVVKRLREERLAADDAARAEAWQMNVDRELARAEGRTEWVEARLDAATLRRETRAEQRAFRKEEGPAHQHALAQARHDRNDAEDAYKRGSWEIAVEQGFARAEGRTAWVEANERAVLARREYKKALRELRRSRTRGTVGRIKESDEQLKARAKVNDARADAIEEATKRHAIALAELRDAKRAGVTDDQLKVFADREAELRAARDNLCADTRKVRLEEEDARVQARSEAGKARVSEEAMLREEWRRLKDAADVEYRLARAAEKARRKDEKAQAREAREAMREERNAKVEAAKTRERELLTSYQIAQADMQDAYMEAQDAQRRQIRAIRAEERAAAPAIREEERAQAARRRAEKVARDDAAAAAYRELMKERAYARSLERDAAIDSTDVAYRAMCGDLDDKGVK